MPRTVLLIDDDPLFGETAATVLRNRNGLNVLRAANGHEALKQIDRHRLRISLILCDLNMPDFDGIELVEAFRRQNLRVPILFITGALPAVVKAADALARVHGLNVVDTLLKPVKLERMSAIVDDCMARSFA